MFDSTPNKSTKWSLLGPESNAIVFLNICCCLFTSQAYSEVHDREYTPKSQIGSYIKCLLNYYIVACNKLTSLSE